MTRLKLTIQYTKPVKRTNSPLSGFYVFKLIPQ